MARVHFKFTYKAFLKGTEESMIQTMEKQMGNPVMLSMQAFDVRA